MHDNTQHLYNNLDLRKLLIPIIVEQLLSSLMGTADTMMVSNVGSVAISAVSLVDSINTLILNIFSALATGGAIVCSQYIGKQRIDRANAAGRQLVLSMFAISTVISAVCVIFRRPLLSLVFGRVDADVMENALIYMLITGLSFPFIGLYNASAALFRSSGNSRLPMTVSMISNCINIVGNWGVPVPPCRHCYPEYSAPLSSCIIRQSRRRLYASITIFQYDPTFQWSR